jgi:hypothetical protein
MEALREDDLGKAMLEGDTKPGYSLSAEGLVYVRRAPSLHPVLYVPRHATQLLYILVSASHA